MAANSALLEPPFPSLLGKPLGRIITLTRKEEGEYYTQRGEEGSSSSSIPPVSFPQAIIAVALLPSSSFSCSNPVFTRAALPLSSPGVKDVRTPRKFL